MIDLPGSNKVIEVIKKIQKKNKELDPAYVPECFHEPNKSFLRRLIDFINPISHPAELKSTDSLKPSDQGQKATLSKVPSKHLQSVGNGLE